MFSRSDIENLLPDIKSCNWTSEPLNEVEKIKNLQSLAPAIVYSPQEQIILFANTIKGEREWIEAEGFYYNFRYCEIIEVPKWHLFFTEDVAVIWKEYQLISFDDAPKSSGKDFCHHCNSSNLYWVMMAARCRNCDRIILGG